MGINTSKENSLEVSKKNSLEVSKEHKLVTAYKNNHRVQCKNLLSEVGFCISEQKACDFKLSKIYTKADTLCNEFEKLVSNAESTPNVYISIRNNFNSVRTSVEWDINDKPIVRYYFE